MTLEYDNTHNYDANLRNLMHTPVFVAMTRVLGKFTTCNETPAAAATPTDIQNSFTIHQVSKTLAPYIKAKERTLFYK